MPLESCLAGPRRTILVPGELVVAVHVPRPRRPAVSSFMKLGARRYLVISIAMAAITLELEEGSVATARAAVGACAPTACRLPTLERALAGRRLSDGLADVVAASHLEPLAPIDDVRGSAAYRRDAVLTLLRRLVRDLADKRP
ncbi:MAG: hypothetical protein JOZ15_04920 [Acidobacteria bacterium]|nr:hypothetical protein [Acidobacteriota bacterium]